MKLSKFILLLSLLSNTGFAQTPSLIEIRNLVPATETQFKVFGKGIVNKETGDSIALVCAQINQFYGQPLSNPCNAMRFIYFQGGNPTPYYLSDRLISGKYLIYHSDELLGIQSKPIAFNDAHTEELIEQSAQILIRDLSLDRSFGKVASEAVHDRDGWNWSSRPTRVNAKKFDQLARNISFIYRTSLPADHPHAGIIFLSGY